jgi:hypothetical protein
MTLRGGISLPEAAKIGLIKLEKFQNLPRSAGKYSRDGRMVAMSRKGQKIGKAANFGEIRE